MVQKDAILAEANGANNRNSASKHSNKRRGMKRKRKPKKKRRHPNAAQVPIKHEKPDENEQSQDERIEYEYVSAPVLNKGDPYYEEFKKIFECFAPPEELCMSKEERERQEKEGAKMDVAPNHSEQKSGDEDKTEEDKSEETAVSKRERKKQKRLSVAVLKQIAPRPDLVEVWDVTAGDPALLLHLKASRNTVPVPRHWCQKRKYLQNKRGLEKPPFELPEFIAATGITKIRQAVQEQEDEKKMKQKQRERMQPKLHKIDIDYQVLHDAFFKYQTKPNLTIMGDVYHEGKEFEVKLKEKRPGVLSDDLKAALGMPEEAPPPWLINMQRYGPPPSYPNLKIPGLNAPIPPGTSFGYHPGGWGKPPVDQFGKPLYGDVFGPATIAADSASIQPIDRRHWGELEEEEEEASSEEEEESEEESSAAEAEEGEESAAEKTPVRQPFADAADIASGAATPTGIATPDHVVLRKQTRVEPEDQQPRALYQVIPQREARIGSETFGSAHTYVIGGADREEKEKEKDKKKKGKEPVNIIKSQKTKGVEVTLEPSELENLTKETLQEMYESEVAAGVRPREDVSDIIAEHAKKKQQHKKKKEGKDKDKYKFKF